MKKIFLILILFLSSCSFMPFSKTDKLVDDKVILNNTWSQKQVSNKITSRTKKSPVKNIQAEKSYYLEYKDKIEDIIKKWESDKLLQMKDELLQSENKLWEDLKKARKMKKNKEIKEINKDLQSIKRLRTEFWL